MPLLIALIILIFIALVQYIKPSSKPQKIFGSFYFPFCLISIHRMISTRPQLGRCELSAKAYIWLGPLGENDTGLPVYYYLVPPYSCGVTNSNCRNTAFGGESKILIAPYLSVDTMCIKFQIYSSEDIYMNLYTRRREDI